MLQMNAAGLALLARAEQGERIPVVPLIFMGPAEPDDYTGSFVPQYWSACPSPLVWNSQTWVNQDIGISEIEDAISGLPDITLTLPGVTPSQRAFAFVSMDGIAVRIRDAWVDPMTGEVADAPLVWSGEVDKVGWEEGSQAVVIITAIHRGKAALRPKPIRYTNDEQQRRHPGDTSLNVDPLTDSGSLIWPAGSYYGKK